MGIIIDCPNGHTLRLKDKYAGRSGYCPHCKAKVIVPSRAAFSEDDIAEVLGSPAPFVPEQPERPSEEFVHQDPRHDEKSLGSGISLLDSSVIRPQKLCPHCSKRTSFAFSVCPTCGTPLPEVEAQPSH